MNNKKARLFLRIGLVIFALSVIGLLICIIRSYYLLEARFPNDPDIVRNEFLFSLGMGIFILYPTLAIELSCIRSVYKILKYQPKKIAKICYWISVVLSVSTLVFQCLILVIVNISPGTSLDNYAVDIFLLTGWPVFILSFVLGSIPIKHQT